MKAKLAQKAVQDESANLMETKEHIKELREEMKAKKEEILCELSLVYKDKLEIFINSVFSTINAYTDMFTEGINIIDNLLVEDQEESVVEVVERDSIVKRSITNVKSLFERSSPNKRISNDIKDYIKVDKKSLDSIQNDSKALIEILTNIAEDIYKILNNFVEVDYVMSNYTSSLSNLSLKYKELVSNMVNIHDQDISNCLNIINVVFEQLSKAYTNFDADGEISSETEETKFKIETMINSSKLEYKLIKNELEEYKSIEEAYSKEVSSKRLDSFMGKYEKFKNKIVNNHEELEKIKEYLTNRMDDLRYTFIDEIKEFYIQERENLNSLQTIIQTNENMIKINETIASMNSRDDIIRNEDKVFLDPLKITEEKAKRSNVDNTQVHVAYKVGDFTVDSEEGSKENSKEIINEEDYSIDQIPFEMSPTHLTKYTKRLSVDTPAISLLAVQELEEEKKPSVEKRSKFSMKKSSSIIVDNKSQKLIATKEQSTKIEIIELSESEDEEKEESRNGVNLPKGVETAEWLNQLAKVVYSWYTDKKSEEFTDIICKQLHKVYNDDEKPNFLGEIKVLDVSIGGAAPTFMSFQKHESALHEFLGDVDVSFRGTVDITLSTEVYLNFRQTNYALIPITLRVLVKGVTGKLRVFLTQNMERMNWYAFVGQPNFKFEVDFIIGKDNKMSFSVFPKVKKFIEDLLAKKMHKFILPNKKRLEMPFYPDKKLMF